jgi:hypothetical protein
VGRMGTIQIHQSLLVDVERDDRGGEEEEVDEAPPPPKVLVLGFSLS